MGNCQITEEKASKYYNHGLSYGATWGTGIIAGNKDSEGRGASTGGLTKVGDETDVLFIWFSATVKGVLSVLRTPLGSTAITEKLASGVDICTVSGAVYFAKVPVEPGDSIDFAYSAGSGTINTIIVRKVGME